MPPIFSEKNKKFLLVTELWSANVALKAKYITHLSIYIEKYNLSAVLFNLNLDIHIHTNTSFFAGNDFYCTGQYIRSKEPLTVL